MFYLIIVNHNNMRLVNRNSLLIANNKVGSLDLWGKEDSNFLYLVDSRQIVKILYYSYYSQRLYSIFDQNKNMLQWLLYYLR